MMTVCRRIHVAWLRFRLASIEREIHAMQAEIEALKRLSEGARVKRGLLRAALIAAECGFFTKGRSST